MTNQPEGQHPVPAWSETWALSAQVAVSGPSLYHEQTVEVVSKLEAEQAIKRIEAQVQKRLGEALLTPEALELAAQALDDADSAGGHVPAQARAAVAAAWDAATGHSSLEEDSDGC